MKFWFSKSQTPAPAPEQSAAPAAPQPAVAPTPPPAIKPKLKLATQGDAAKPAAAPAPAQQPPDAAAAAPAAPAAEQPQAPVEDLPQGPSQRELYRNLMDALYDAVLLVDDKGYVVDSNRRIEHTFGYAPDEMWDMPLHKLVKGFGPMVLAKLAEPLTEGRPVIISGRGIRKNGSLFEAEMSVSKVKLLRFETMLFTVRDVTKRILAIQEKARAQAKAAGTVKPVKGVLRCAKKPASS